MRFKHSICRYDEDDVVQRVFALMGFPPPPPGKARQCAEEVLKMGAFEKMTNVIVQCGRLAVLLKMLDAPRIEPTVEQVKDDKQIGKSLCVVSAQARTSVEIHAGIGAIFYCVESDTLVSQVAPITGAGMDRRRDYLISVLETTRDTLERTFS